MQRPRITSNRMLAEMLEHQHHLAHQTLIKVEQIMTAVEDLKREMAETRTAVGDMLTEFQELIDKLSNLPNVDAEVAAIAADMDALQTEIRTKLDADNPPPPPEPTE